jgi:Fanconi anemia group M protein
MEKTRELLEMGSRHPKIGKLCSILTQTFQAKPGSKVIVFANYREMVREIIDVLSRLEGIRPVEFVGQKGGLSQKEQVQRIEDFKLDKYNVLVGTCISEEGLDIPAMDLAVFYEPVPSEIRSIQRRGRVGRQTVGRVIVLITKGTRDEAYYWTAKQKERRMRSTLKDMSRGVKQTHL